MTNYKKTKLDIPNLQDTILSLEDLIFATLFTEKGLSKYELIKHIKEKYGNTCQTLYAFRESDAEALIEGDVKLQEEEIDYENVSKTINRMLNKGFLVQRNGEYAPIFYLTAAGMYELEYRLNTKFYNDIHEFLESYGYDKHNVERFLANRFYNFYIAGEWDEETLIDQYYDWCKSNGLNPKSSNSCKLTKK